MDELMRPGADEKDCAFRQQRIDLIRQFQGTLPKLRRQLRKKLPVEADIDDLLQNVQVALLRRANTGVIDNMNAYINVAVRNTLSRTYRQRAARQEVEMNHCDLVDGTEVENYAPAPGDYGGEPGAQAEAAQFVQFVLDKLSPACRQTLQLYQEGASKEQIAQAQNITVDSVSKYLLRCRETYNKELRRIEEETR